MNKLLIISGPTATGKTALASYFAKKYNGELVSTDSCQIYKGMDIGTGKDQPGDIPIHLIDIVTPDIKYSVSEFQKEAFKVIDEIHSCGKLPIIVGCSGLYTSSVINPKFTTFDIKPNKFLRYFLNKFDIKILQNMYWLLDKKSFEELNKSDINNPHRLVRKIEIKLFQKKIKKIALFKEDARRAEGLNFNLLHISLTSPLSILYDRIDSRVQSRLDQGFLDEIKTLLKKYKWSDPGMQIGAYLCLKPYFDKTDTLENCLQKWRFAEHSDARRQGTWFKTQGGGQLVDITSKNFEKDTHDMVDKWYNKP